MDGELPIAHLAPSGLIPPFPGKIPDRTEPSVMLDEKPNANSAGTWRRRIESDLDYLYRFQSTGPNFGHVYSAVWVESAALTALFKKNRRAANAGKTPGPKPTHARLRQALLKLQANGQQFKSKKQAHSAVCKSLGIKDAARGYGYDSFRRACSSVLHTKESAK